MFHVEQMDEKGTYISIYERQLSPLLLSIIVGTVTQMFNVYQMYEWKKVKRIWENL